jgi:glycosyltransferase 2 family protein
MTWLSSASGLVRRDLLRSPKPENRGRATPRLLSRALGAGLTLLGVIFTALVIVESDALSRLSWGARPWALLFLTCGAYAVLSVLLVLVWATVLDAFAPGCIDAKDAYALYAITQIMKYIPSNVAHFVGRHVTLRRRGVSHFALVCTMVAETAMLLGGACLTVAVLQADVLTAVYAHHVRAEATPIILAVALATCLCATLTWLHGAGMRRLISTGTHRRLVPRLIVALAAAAVFFASTTLLIATVCRLLLDDPAGFSITYVAASLAGAWVVGFIVPGASAGIGVREATAILLLSPAVGPGNAAVIATIYRIVTAGGDALLAGFGELVRRFAAGSAPEPR